MQISSYFKDHEIIRIIDGEPCFWYPNNTEYLYKVLHKLSIVEVIQMPEPEPLHDDDDNNDDDDTDTSNTFMHKSIHCYDDNEFPDIDAPPKKNADKIAINKIRKNEKINMEKLKRFFGQKPKKTDNSRNKNKLFNRQKGIDEKQFNLAIDMINVKQKNITQIKKYEDEEECKLQKENNEIYCYCFGTQILKIDCGWCFTNLLRRNQFVLNNYYDSDGGVDN
jgi:ABC-type antimicrobial peptide transport system permease subunit